MPGIITKEQFGKVEDFEEVAKKIMAIGDAIAKVITESEKIKPITGLKDITKETQKQTDETLRLLKEKKALIDIENKLIQQQKLQQQAKAAETQATIKQTQLIEAQQREKQAKIKTDKLENQETIKANKLLTEKDKLEAKAKQSIIQLELATSKHNKTLQQNRQRISDINKGYKDQVKQGSGLLGTFKNLAKSVAGYALAYVGLRAIIRFITTDLFNLTKQLSALDFAMQTVIKDQNELAFTQDFLRKTAINYGHDIITLTERYVKFRAAAQQSNLTARETMDIFDSMAKISGILGLKTDEINSVFLALEQMISKGKVTTEELRRQLGERLPGAMGIMADAIGVTISQLDKMLKAGEVLSAEVLPKFAKAAEQAYGVEAVNRIETLIAAHGRLTTSWKLFVQELSADSSYKKAIENWTNLFSRMRIIGGDLFGDGINLLEKYMIMTTKSGDAVNKMVTDLDQLSFEDINSSEMAENTIKSLTDVGIKIKHATELWNEYYNTRDAERQMDQDKFTFTTGVDLADFKNVLDTAQSDIESFSKLGKGALKDAFVVSSDALSKGFTNYKEYLNNIRVLYETEETKRIKKELELEDGKYMSIQELEQKLLNTTDENTKKKLEFLIKNLFIPTREATQRAKAELDKASKDYMTLQEFKKILSTTTDENEKKKLRNLYKNQKIELGILQENYNNRLALEVEINNRLAALDKGGKAKSVKDDSFKITQERQKAELEALKKSQQEELRVQEEILAEKFQNENDYQAALEDQKAANDQALIDLEIKHQTELLALVEKGSLDEAKILADREKLYADSEKNITDAQIAERKRGQARIEQILKEEQRQKKAQDEAAVADLYSRINDERVVMAEAATEQLKDANNNAERKKIIEDKLALTQSQFERERLEELQKTGFETIEMEQWVSDQIKKLREDEENYKRDISNETRDQQIENLQYIGQAVSNGANFYNQILENQLNKSKELYEDEAAAAGDSAEKKYLAEKKYQDEQRKIKRRQAIADKAQALFNIGLQLAMAEAKLNPFQIAAAILAIGTVLATPIPEFAEGIEFAPETFIAGDAPKGSGKKGAKELILKPDGSAVLTPDKPTLYSDKSFIGSTILPHDETQKWLANYAVNQTYDMLDMSESNRILKNIARNTRKNIVLFERNGKTVMQRGYIKSTLT